ncbi:hypothetical protein GGR58DRAFT_23194 [Xylaria digitata]|nr:hypothetical protein GGR58DRAFT_23194 [Xylaria digitata]
MSVRADHPFPPIGSRRADNYFEIEILPSDKPTDEPPIVGIGLCGEFLDLGNGFPGWEYMNPSTGYHGDNGSIYDSEMGDYLQIRTGRLYEVGDTVGCGVDWDQQSVYYTLNGEHVGRIQSSVIRRKCYPAVTMWKSPCIVKVNFGEESFKFSP